MDTATVLLIVLLGAATALCVTAVWGIFEMVKTARSVRVLADDLDARLVPLIEKADVAFDVVNVELLRIDEFGIAHVKDMSHRVAFDLAGQKLQEGGEIFALQTASALELPDDRP